MNTVKKKPIARAVSLFSNCGAGDVGFARAGFTFEIMAELDDRRLEVALLNHPEATGVAGDLTETWTRVVKVWREAHGDERPALLAACPPCQGMSSARGGRGKFDDMIAGGKDSRNLLVSVIIEVANALKPRSIVVENVPAFLTRAVPDPTSGRPVSAALLLIDALKADYAPFAISADLADWGVPQHRKRAFITLIRRDEVDVNALVGAGKVPFPAHSHGAGQPRSHINIKSALATLAAGPLDAASVTGATDASDPLHFVPVWSPIRYRMVAAIPRDIGASAWGNNQCSSCDSVTKDLDAAACHACGSPLLRPVVASDEGGWRLVRGFKTSSYTRMRSNEPSATVTTASGHIGSDKTLHPWENRVLSIRECAYLQTLPEDFDWGDALRKWGHTTVREMIGEAVPPAFTEKHGRALLAVLDVHGPVTPGLMSVNDPRMVKADDALFRARNLGVQQVTAP